MNESILAFCYIHSLNDEKNRCNLHNRYLEVVSKGKSHAFPLDALTSITFSHKKIWLPLVFGGLLASLSTVSLIKQLTNPWYAFISLLIGMFLFYYGNQGTQIMTIVSGADQTHFFIGKVTPNLESFRDYVLDFRFDRKGKSIFLILPDEKFSLSGDLVPEAFNVKKFTCLTRSQFDKRKPGSNESVLEIDPLKVRDEIKYEYEDRVNGLVPTVYGRIPIDAVVSHNLG